MSLEQRKCAPLLGTAPVVWNGALERVQALACRCRCQAATRGTTARLYLAGSGWPACCPPETLLARPFGSIGCAVTTPECMLQHTAEYDTKLRWTSRRCQDMHTCSSGIRRIQSSEHFCHQILPLTVLCDNLSPVRPAEYIESHGTLQTSAT